MKLRNGFVSNSSTSSFVVAGVLLSEDTFNERYESDGKWSYLGLPEGCDPFKSEYSEDEVVLGKHVHSIDHGEIARIDPDSWKEVLVKAKKSLVEAGYPEEEVRFYHIGE
jgi:hypothetical protein